MSPGSEPSQSPEFLASIDAAWEAANNANLAFEPYGEARDSLAAARIAQLIGSLGVEGVTVDIEEGTIPRLEAAATEAKALFRANTYFDEAAPLMLAENSPFGSHQETSPRIDSPLCTQADLTAFASSRAYQPRLAVQAFNIVRSLGYNADPETKIDVIDASAYAPITDESHPDYGKFRTVTIRLEGGKTIAVDTSALFLALESWVETTPTDIRNLGDIIVSFLAEYRNECRPDLEPLPVKRRPATIEGAVQARRAELEAMPIRKLLLDERSIDGGVKKIVTNNALRRFGFLVDGPETLPSFSQFIHGLTETCPLGFVELRTPGTRGVGLEPAAFIAVIEAIETELEQGRERPKYYTPASREIILQYVAALRRTFLPDELNHKRPPRTVGVGFLRPKVEQNDTPQAAQTFDGPSVAKAIARLFRRNKQ